MPAPANCIGMAPESLDGGDRPRPTALAKEEIRASMRARRAAMLPEERARLTSLIEQALFGLPEVSDARTILLYSSFGTEVTTEGMIGRMLEQGKRVLLPYVVDDRTMEAAEVRAGEALVPGRHGPGEPRNRTPVTPDAIELVVVPGLAFDQRGYRLGYGGGHYDRYLSRIGRAGLRVGVAFSFQIVDRIPEEPGDERVDVVVTDEGALDLRP